MPINYSEYPDSGHILAVSTAVAEGTVEDVSC